jgi:outer membrane lipoprotein-sorting protein
MSNKNDCQNRREAVTALVLGELEAAAADEIKNHIDTCRNCRLLYQALTEEEVNVRSAFKAIDDRGKVIEDRLVAQLDKGSRAHDDVSAGQAEFQAKKSVVTQPNVWRTIMKNRITKLAAAAVIIIAIVLATNFLDKTILPVSATTVLAQATKAVANLRSVHIKAQIRTIAHDNFELIGLNYDFVPHEMWKEFDGTFHGKWRIEKPGRVVVMDGKSSLLLIRPNYAAKGGIGTGFVGWLKPLLDVDKVLDSEKKLAQEQGSKLQLTREKGLDGNDKLLVSVEALAQGDFTNDWLKNKSIDASDNLRIYTFDAETKFLETLEVYVHTDEGDVLVLEITDIEYNLDINPTLFTLELPEDVIWSERPKKLADNEKYEQMGPKEMAQAFFEACADEDWDEFLKFWSTSAVAQGIKDYLGGLEIVSIGEPFKSGRYAGWFVPYEIKLRSGRIKKFNLAVRNDNPAKRYVVDGGI